MIPWRSAGVVGESVTS